MHVYHNLFTRSSERNGITFFFKRECFIVAGNNIKKKDWLSQLAHFDFCVRFAVVFLCTKYLVSVLRFG